MPGVLPCPYYYKPCPQATTGPAPEVVEASAMQILNEMNEIQSGFEDDLGLAMISCDMVHLVLLWNYPLSISLILLQPACYFLPEHRPHYVFAHVGDLVNSGFLEAADGSATRSGGSACQ